MNSWCFLLLRACVERECLHKRKSKLMFNAFFPESCGETMVFSSSSLLQPLSHCHCALLNSSAHFGKIYWKVCRTSQPLKHQYLLFSNELYIISGVSPSVIFHVQKVKPKIAKFDVQCQTSYGTLSAPPHLK